ncbi:tryptophan--tRNA ligase [Candidatus Enterovibrio escicola]|uniref:Tryptophan--tRNA ligase n=1 Tax=Candidatus Enterovibrio escicola TaxID=1927127 RepID=A0A2A5T743_9GAMM|nr:tryptophan--tRNA ligase [Candidatus Enterovibrio escacola]PCS23967.1 Tryptophanyl-tRNA synthetase [Candidatus Enterovibrio escacola]
MSYTILTGDRATGLLHLGHYIGSLKLRVALQDDHQQSILIADLQGLTDNGHDPEKVSGNILNVMADYLAVGIDPAKTNICLQSGLPALSELTMYYANIVSISRLERNPTVKAEIANKSFGNSIPAGFFTYPISQAADITAFRADCVPVGDDQIPMIEQTNEIVRKINKIAGSDILVECEPLLSKVTRLPSVDGKAKMSKSLGNTITLSADEKEITAAVNKMYTDPNHLKVTDPGQIEGNVVFTYLDAFHPDEDLVQELKLHYIKGGLGDGKVKNILEECLQETLRPIREKRRKLINDKGMLLEILKHGTEKAVVETNKVLYDVKQAFGLNLFI